MRRLTKLSITAAAGLAAAATIANAKVISSMDEVKVSTTQINFEEMRLKDTMTFGSPEVGQPYSTLGLVLPSQVIDANVMAGEKTKVGIKSTGVSTVDNSNYQSIAFTRPQRVVGFMVRSERATSIRVTAMDSKGKVLDEVELKASSEAQFVGFMMRDPSITVVRVVAPHATMADALASPTVITDVAFAAIVEDGASDGVDGGQANGGFTSDFGLARAVGSTGPNLSAIALASGGVSGSGASAGVGTGAARNPGNQNPNLPESNLSQTPVFIPEPATALIGLPALVMLSLRRRGQA